MENSLTESDGKAANASPACGDFFQTVAKVTLEVSHESAEAPRVCKTSSITFCRLKIYNWIHLTYRSVLGF